jgi:hypothetical protein
MTQMWGVRTPYEGVRSHSRGLVRTRGGPRPSWRSVLYIQGSSTFPWGPELTVDALEYITFSGHVASPEPPTWWGQALLLAQSSHPRLGRVMVWSHIQLLYHATKDSRVGTASSYSSKGYPSFRVPTQTNTETIIYPFAFSHLLFNLVLNLCSLIFIHYLSMFVVGDLFSNAMNQEQGNTKC